MARRLSSTWLGVPAGLGVVAIVWLFVSGPSSKPASIGGPGDGDPAAEAPPEQVGPVGCGLSKGDPSRPKGKHAKATEEAEEKPLSKAEGVFGRVLDTREAPIP